MPKRYGYSGWPPWWTSVSTSGRCSSSHTLDVAGDGRRLEPSPSMIVTISWSSVDQQRRAAGCTTRSSAAGRAARMPSRADAQAVALGDRAEVARRVAHRPGDLAGHHRRRRPRPWPSRCRRRRPRGRRPAARRSPRRCPGCGTTHTVLVGQGVDLLGHRDDVLVVGQDHDLVGRRRLDRLEQLGGRRVHRLAAGDDALHAERVEDAADAVAGGHRHDGRLDRLVRARAGLGPGAASRTQRSSSTCSSRSVTRMLRGRPQSMAASIGGADVVGVDVAVPDAVAADHHDRVADAGPHVLERRDGLVGRLEEVHDLVAQVGEVRRRRGRRRRAGVPWPSASASSASTIALAVAGLGHAAGRRPRGAARRAAAARPVPPASTTPASASTGSSSGVRASASAAGGLGRLEHVDQQRRPRRLGRGGRRPRPPRTTVRMVPSTGRITAP